MKTGRLSIVLFSALVSVAVPSCKRHSGASEHRAEPVKVEVISVSEESAVSTNGFVGMLEPVKSTTLSAKHSGTLVELRVRKGDRVVKGQTVAVIGSQSVKSTYEMAHATLEQAEDGYRRASQVYEAGAVADVKMVELSTQLSKARAAADAADKALEDCNIKAPFDGLVSEVYCDEGVELDFFSPIVKVVDTSELEVRISVPENEISGVSVGQQARLEAAGETALGCKVASRGVVASALSHSFDCTLKLDRQDASLLPGMVCKVYLDRQEESGIVVPSSVLQTGSEGRYLWIVRGGAVCRQYVLVGPFSGKGVLITSGLEDGDMVIVKGYQKVSSGMAVDAQMADLAEVL